MTHIDEGKERPMGRRRMLTLMGPALLLGLAMPGAGLVTAAPRIIKIYKNPECSCCGLWTKYLEARGFKAEVTMVDDLEPIKLKAGVPDDLASCHTALVDGYVVEGHVPLPAIERMLNERPNILGIAVPGMPAGSPGMPSVDIDPYQAIAFAVDRTRTIYMSF